MYFLFLLLFFIPFSFCFLLIFISIHFWQYSIKNSNHRNLQNKEKEDTKGKQIHCDVCCFLMNMCPFAYGMLLVSISVYFWYCSCPCFPCFPCFPLRAKGRSAGEGINLNPRVYISGILLWHRGGASVRFLARCMCVAS